MKCVEAHRKAYVMKQKNHVTRLFLWLFAAALGLGIPFSAKAASETAALNSVEETADLNYEELMKAQERAVAANNILMQYFYDIGGWGEYPDYYGGCYIGDDNLYHIRLTASSDQAKETLDTLFGEYMDVVVYESCDASFNDLQEYVHTVAYDIMDAGYDVASWYVDVTNGNVVVRVLPECIEAVQAMVDNELDFLHSYNAEAEADSCNYAGPSIIIEQGAYMQHDAAPIYGGDRIGINGYGYSAGVCGYFNGQKALVTAGHGVTTGDTVQYNGVNIGTAAKIQFSHNEAGDYAVFVLNDAAELTHKIGNTEHGITILNKGIVSTPTVGTYIQKYGSTSGYAYGKIASVNEVFNSMNYNIKLTGLTHAILTSGSNAGGDSGGPYLIQNAFCGVHSGSANKGQDVFFTPYASIADAGFSAIARHDCTSWSDAGPGGHSGYCAVCKEVVVESHTDYWNPTNERCSRCGRTGPIFVEGN